MFATVPSSWLADLLDGLFYGGYLQATEDQCRGLAAGFIGPNLVANLADFITGVGNRWPGSIFGGYAPPSYSQLRLWLDTPPGEADLDALTGPAAAAAMEAGTHRADPWWQIHRWVGIEAYLGVLAACLPGGSPPSVRRHAEATFQRIPTLNGLSPLPCHQRNSGTLAAFQAWWDATVAALVRRWRDQPWHDSVPVRLPHVCPDLGTHLGQPTGEHLAHLTRLKNQQHWFCIQQLNQAAGDPVPTPDGWLGALASVALAAWQAGDDLELDAADVSHFIALRGWMPKAGLSACLPPLDAALGNILMVPAAALTIPHPRYQPLLAAINGLVVRVATRGLPTTWDVLVYGPVPDLFAYLVIHPPGGPLLLGPGSAPVGGPTIDFASWVRRMNTHYNIPSG
jgi:hypothetical protein